MTSYRVSKGSEKEVFPKISNLTSDSRTLPSQIQSHCLLTVNFLQVLDSQIGNFFFVLFDFQILRNRVVEGSSLLECEAVPLVERFPKFGRQVVSLFPPRR